MARNDRHARARRLTVLAAFAGAPLVLLRLPEPDPAPVAAPEADPCAPAPDPDETSTSTSTTTTTTTTLPDETSVPSSVPCPSVPGSDPTTPDATAPDSAVPDSAVPDSSVPDSLVPGSDLPSGSEPAPPDSGPTDAEPDISTDESSAAPAAPESTTPPTTAPPESTTTLPPDLGVPDLPPPPPEGWPVRPITFPVAGPVTYFDDWGACRGGAGCPRHHIGNDVIGMRLQPLLAARDGTVTHLVLDHVTAGWGVVITDAEGWDYRYYHVNNDTPGTDDGSDPPEWRLAAGIGEGSVVRAGQVVAYLGDSGNSETSVPHLHFEIHQPDRTPINPYGSLRAAEAAQRCTPLGDGSEETLLPVPPPANVTVEVSTRTGRGTFHLGPDGAVWLTGDALTVGWDRHAAEEPACSTTAPGAVPGATEPAALATPWMRDGPDTPDPPTDS